VTISTHVLDTSRGRPAAGVPVALEARGDDGSWHTVATAMTDADGRAGPLDGGTAGGSRRLVFATAAYAPEGFFPVVAVTFHPQAGEHCHVPLLLSPFGYSTYRGS
jgi:hydroxyisourate hydrolase